MVQLSTRLQDQPTDKLIGTEFLREIMFWVLVALVEWNYWMSRLRLAFQFHVVLQDEHPSTSVWGHNTTHLAGRGDNTCVLPVAVPDG